MKEMAWAGQPRAGAMASDAPAISGGRAGGSGSPALPHRLLLSVSKVADTESFQNENEPSGTQGHLPPPPGRLPREGAGRDALTGPSPHRYYPATLFPSGPLSS